MKLYQQRILETRVYQVLYTVTARNRQEAAEKVKIGDTINEAEERCLEVIHRVPAEDIVEIGGGKTA